MKKPSKPAPAKTGVEIDDHGRRLHIYLDDTPQAIQTLLTYLEKLLAFKDGT